jgi:7-keto-8-aminopelargonate synthetase-like enzyme
MGSTNERTMIITSLNKGFGASGGAIEPLPVMDHDGV